MTSQGPETRAPRTYGGWRRTRGIGLFGAGAAGTAAVLLCIVGVLVLASTSLRAGVLGAAPAAFAIGIVLARVDGTSLGSLAARRLQWLWGTARGHTTYVGTVLSENPRAWDLPGVLAPTRLLSAGDGRGGDFGVVWNRRTGHLTATLRCAATSTWLVDTDDADAWVSNWHAWLASLGYLPMVRWAAVTIETAPEPGTTLQDRVLPLIDPNAPEDVRRLMQELVVHSPAASAAVDTRVSITFDPAASPQRLRGVDEAVAEVSRQLVGLESSLGTCGVSVLGRATAAELTGAVRAAFDPASRGDVQRTLDRVRREALAEVPWHQAGPIGAQETWDAYRHDSGLSVSWCWSEAPRQQVTSGVLTRLLSPGRFPRRVTLLYRPLSAGDAARVLEAQVNAAAFRDAYRRAQRRDESARDVADRLRAQRAAAEEAQGAGVVLLSLYVTVTVTDPADLPEAVADIEARADQSKIRLRRLYGGQAVGFAASLPAGIHPAALRRL